MKSVVSEKGQVTIPKAIRDRLGIRPGETLEFEANDGKLVGTKASTRDPVDEVYGILKSRKTTDEWLNELRSEVDGV